MGSFDPFDDLLPEPGFDDAGPGLELVTCILAFGVELCRGAGMFETILAVEFPPTAPKVTVSSVLVCASMLLQTVVLIGILLSAGHVKSV